MGDLLLGLDIGTSGVKAGLVDAEGKLVGLGRAAHENEKPHPGWVECDPEVWWRGVLEAIREACTTAKAGCERVAAVGISALFPAVIAMDEQGQALHPAILYSDGRSIAQVGRIAEVMPREEYERRIGNVLMPGTCAVTSMAWLREERPEIYGRADCLGFANTYVAHRLTGHFATDPSAVSLSGLAEVGDPWRWSGELCERMEVDAGKLPRVLGAAEVVGEVTREAARETGLREGTPVACGCGDVVASTMAAGVTGDDMVLCTTGSTDCVTMPLRRPIEDRRWANCAYIPRGLWIAIGTMTSTGASVEWFVREVMGSSGEAGLEAMTELAASSSPGAGGVVFLPYLQGERTPVWDPEARGMFFGLSASTGRGDLARSVFEGIAMGMRQVIESLEESLGRPAPEICVVGGATRNALWMEMRADVLQRELRVWEFQEASALGAALLGGRAAGWWESFEAAAGRARQGRRPRTVSPRPEVAEVYARGYGVYRGLYPAMRGVGA